GRQHGPRGHRPLSQRHGHHPLEPDVGHAQEARVHVAPGAAQLGRHAGALAPGGRISARPDARRKERRRDGGSGGAAGGGVLVSARCSAPQLPEPGPAARVTSSGAFPARPGPAGFSPRPRSLLFLPKDRDVNSCLWSSSLLLLVLEISEKLPITAKLRLPFFPLSLTLLVAKTSLSSPPWPEVKLPDPLEEAKYHAEVVQKVNEMIATGQYGRLFAVVHFASKQWKVTSEDLIMMDNVLEAECGDRIRMEKVLLVGADDFTLIGRPLLGKDLVRVEATVIEKTESWPKINMRFWKRHNYQRKKNMTEREEEHGRV
uniref:Large ribosomal subunit protein bL21m n=1 Tax=Apteryx owenii TaxID=8824 RepID=A0A8B9PIZ3_APTOW